MNPVYTPVMAALAHFSAGTSTAELYESAKMVMKRAGFKRRDLDTSPNNGTFMRFLGRLARAQRVFVLIHKPQLRVVAFEVGQPAAAEPIHSILYLHCQNDQCTTPRYSLQMVKRVDRQRFLCSICRHMTCYTLKDLMRHKAACAKRWSLGTKLIGGLPSTRLRYFAGHRVHTKQTLKRRLTTLGVPTKFCSLFDDGWFNFTMPSHDYFMLYTPHFYRFGQYGCLGH